VQGDGASFPQGFPAKKYGEYQALLKIEVDIKYFNEINIVILHF
jgi:hypothetical protein